MIYIYINIYIYIYIYIYIQRNSWSLARNILPYISLSPSLSLSLSLSLSIPPSLPSLPPSLPTSLYLSISLSIYLSPSLPYSFPPSTPPSLPHTHSTHTDDAELGHITRTSVLTPDVRNATPRLGHQLHSGAVSITRHRKLVETLELSVGWTMWLSCYNGVFRWSTSCYIIMGSIYSIISCYNGVTGNGST